MCKNPHTSDTTMIKNYKLGKLKCNITSNGKFNYMITENLIKKYASVVLLNTVDSLYNHDEEAINQFYKRFVKVNKNNKHLKNNKKDNEVIDELILDLLEKDFTKNEIGQTLQTEMVKENEKAIDELTTILDEKLRPIEPQLRPIFKDDQQYNEFRKYTTENLVVSNLDLNNAVLKALKTMKISGMPVIQIKQLISEIA